MLTFSQTTQLVELRKIATEQGRDDVLTKIDALLQGETPQDSMSREGRQQKAEEDIKLQQAELTQLKDQQRQLLELADAATAANRPDVLNKINTLATSIDKEIFDIEDVTEEVTGAGSAALEAVSGGLLGDEAQSWVVSGLTGEDYDSVLEETRRIQEEFAEDHPAIDLGIRIASGFVPSVALAKVVGVGTTFVGGALRQGGLTSAEIGTYSFMEGEGGVEQRLQNVAETFQNPLALGATALAGTVGGIAGRGVGRAQEIERSVVQTLEEEGRKLQRLRTGKDESVGTDVINTAQISGDQAVITFYNQNGRMPRGIEITDIYKQIAEETGIPIGRIMQLELKAGKRKVDLDYREKDIGEIRRRAKVSGGFVTEQQAIESRGFFKNFYESKLEPLVLVAKRRVGGRAAGNFQRMATNMARQQQASDAVLTSEPVKKLAIRLENDSTGVIRQRILNFSNSSLASSVRRKEFNELKKMLNKNEMDGLRSLLRLRIEQAGEYRKFVYGALPVDPLYLPSQTLSQTQLSHTLRRRNMPENAVDANMMQRKRGYLTADEAKEYENPLVVLRDKLSADEGVIQLHKNFKLDNILNRVRNETASIKQVQKDIEAGTASFTQLKAALREEGAGENVVAEAVDLVRSLMVNGARGPDGWLANLRKLGYMGTIGNPYSALLNFGDVSNTVVNFGLDNTTAGVVNYLKKNNLAVSVDDVGLANQATGEFLREGSTAWNRRFNNLSNVTFKASGFRGADVAGKTVTLNAAIQRGRQMAADGTLAKEYGWLFNGNEIKLLRRDLLQGNKTDRVREFAGAELAKLQPSDLAQMPKWYLDNPNGRILYMLRTFGLKQLQQVNRLVLETWKEGVKRNDNRLKAEAVKNAAAYLVVVGGGNTLLNELRQPIKQRRDAFEIDEMQEYFVDFMLGLASVNTLSTYNLERASEGDAKDLIMAFFPASLNMVEDFAADTAQLVSGEEDLDDLFFEGRAAQWLPFMRVAQPYLEETFD